MIKVDFFFCLRFFGVEKVFFIEFYDKIYGFDLMLFIDFFLIYCLFWFVFYGIGFLKGRFYIVLVKLG